ncbi:substrate-binding domain-containing protein [Streptomyces mutabilis]|uniref:substrate-binding domain-containing protein n=1 Tax=Streptomyces mutabilis TaxID=67332 RepID=UPI000AAF213E|nr:substrate-binding domain-containing protein [Streptomyces mutabilis]
MPHGVARALREGSPRVVVLNIDAGMEGHYSSCYILGLDKLAAHDHVLLVRHGQHTAQSTQQVLDVIAPRAVNRFGDTYLTGRELDDLGGGWRDGLAAHTALQLRHLVEQGHTAIATALPDTGSPLAATRLRFTAHGACDLGIRTRGSFVAPSGRAACAEAVRAFLTGAPEVTAVAGFNDDVALRVLMALRDLGHRVPDDIAVIGSTTTGTAPTPLRG